VAVSQPATRAAAGSGRWQQAQTRPGRLVVHAIEADRASEYASSVRTASRSSCAHVATSQSLGCQQTTGQRRGRVHGCRAGSCAMVFWTVLGFEWAYIAVEFAGAIQKRLALMYGATGTKPAWAVVNVVHRVISKVVGDPGAMTATGSRRVLPDLAQSARNYGPRQALPSRRVS
jgi:hypothetical protein